MLTQTLARRAARPHPRPGWGLWAAWIIATVYGAVASILTFILAPADAEPLNLLPRVIIVALIISLAQWPILYRYLPSLSARQWLGANVLGYIVGFFVYNLGFLIGSLVFSVLNTIRWNGDSLTMVLAGATGGAMAGTVLALAQWLALHPHLHGDPRWVSVGAAAWAAAGPVALLLQHTLRSPLWVWLGTIETLAPIEKISRTIGLAPQVVFALALGGVEGLLIGAITGLALAALVRARWAETA